MSPLVAKDPAVSPLAAAFALLAIPGAAVAGHTNVSVDIPGGDAHSRLTTFMEQTQCVVIQNIDALKGIQTQPIRGHVTPVKALEAMLRGSGFSMKLISTPCTYALFETPESSAVAGSSTPEGRGSAEQEVVVTGSHIRGKRSPTPDLITVSMSDLERSSSVTLSDALRTLPQVHGGGASEDTQLGAEAQTNFTFGSGINLRGLNAGATLLLIDGARVASSGSKGAFSDSSGIPTDAIERIDLLPNSASAIYGADAIGGVVNVIMRKSVVGQETKLSWGSVTEGPMRDLQFSHLAGDEWRYGGAYIALNYYSRSALPNTAREQWSSDLRKFGGDDFNSIASNPGTIIADGRTWGIPPGQDGRGLRPEQLMLDTRNERDRQAGVDALPAHEMLRAFLSSHLGAPEDDIALTASFSRRNTWRNAGGAEASLPVPASNPFYVNPTEGSAPVTVAYNFFKDLGTIRQHIEVSSASAELRARVSLAGPWQVLSRMRYANEHGHSLSENLPGSNALIAALADPDPATALNVFGDGSYTNPATLVAIRTRERESYVSALGDVSLELSGELGNLTAGPIRVALGAEQRSESWTHDISSDDRDDTWERFNFRFVRGVYGEAVVPIVDTANRWAWLDQLELSAAVRAEKYSDVGRIITPRFGLRVAPSSWLNISTSWALASLAPHMGVSGWDSWSTLVPALDAQSATGSSQVLLLLGDNPDLRAESASSLSISAALAPATLAGLRLAASYFSIKAAGRPSAPSYSYNLLNDPTYISLIVRKPSVQQITSACLQNSFTGPVGACPSAQIDAIADLRTHNALSQKTRGLDFSLSYTANALRGAPTVRVLGTYLMSYRISERPGTAYIEQVNTEHNPLALRFRADLEWQPDKWGTSARLNYSGPYRDSTSVPQRPVSAWRTTDIQIFFDTAGRAENESRGTRLSLDAINVFNELPPVLNNSVGVGYDQENGDLTGRLLRFALRKRF